jgi:hypothetical protein
MPTWKDYLKSIGLTDQQIADYEKTFGAELAARMLEGPIRAKAEAEALATRMKEEQTAFDTRYQTEILPEMSRVYTDAINMRTQNAALQERLKAAKEYGFLADEAVVPGSPVVPGAPPGQPVTSTTGNSTVSSAQLTIPALDPRYVQADKFTEAVNNIPEMLGRLTKMSNEHFSLFGSPLLDVDELIAEARKQKKNVQEIWAAKYKVDDKRKEIAAKRQADHDREVAESAVRKYLSEHGQPFTRPPIASLAPRFTPSSPDDARHPWKGSRERKEERRGKLMEAYQRGAGTGTGTGAGTGTVQ